jgi:MinD-like ATPase involved in chromosome partitioning or flagellar assembly
MKVRFDDSLPILARVVAEELGEATLSSGVALRDVTGRLAFFCDTELSKKSQNALAKRLKKELGSYARPDRAIVSASDLGAADILQDSSALAIYANGHRVRLIDRRLVGADWLRAPSRPASPPPRLVFASLKGGVGRSTARSVAAADLASRGRRVLAIDLDMEAPGIGAMLLDDETLPEFGLIDALVENGLSSLDEAFLADLVGPSRLAARAGRIDVIPAFGRRSLQHPADILAKIARAYAEDIGPDGKAATILDQIRSLVDRFSEPTRYDAILIDVRAGLHETTASALLGLGAEIFLFGLDERQTFQGYRALLAHLARFIAPGARLPEWVERLTMVHGKAPADPGLREAFVERCRGLFAEVGLTPRTSRPSDSIPLPAAPFKDVPWDDDDNIDDDELPLDQDISPPGPVAILDDERFRIFDPMQRRDLLLRDVYTSSFGSFLNRVDETFLPGGEDGI